MEERAICWPKTLREAKELQESLKKEIRLTPLHREPSFVAAVDAAFTDDNKIIGVAVLYTYADLKHIETSCALEDVHFPYVPGFLTFREGPALVKAIKLLKKEPDVILFDGQGIAHPRGMGIASHIGLLLDIPSIGVAKSRLFGYYREPGREKGSYSLLLSNKRVIGAVLRTRSNVKPLFVSPGHKIDIKGAIEIVLKCTTKYRIPEPLRKADRLSKELKP